MYFYVTTLAWFGGGALAAGGAGMLGGAMVLSGIVMIPVVVFSVWKLNKSVRGELVRVKREVDEMRSNLARHIKVEQEYRRSPARIKAVDCSIWNCNEHLRAEIDHAQEWLYPWPVISHIWRLVLRLTTGTMLLRSEAILALPLRASASLVRNAARQEIFDRNDRVSSAPLVYPQNSVRFSPGTQKSS